MDSEGRMYILELNSMASLGLHGSYVTAALKAGYTYEALINKILDVAAIRNFGESILEAAKAGMEENVRSQPLRIAARSYLRSHLRTTVLFLKQICEINTTVSLMLVISNILQTMRI
jgi:D-alanine-D-alanine ligase